MKTLSASELVMSKVNGFEVSCVWSKELKELIEERDRLKMERVSLMARVMELEAQLNAVKDFTFINLKG